MKIAVMQPYLFPYIGYFQMINAVDKFVFYDDVNFIKQGWINRNKILVCGQSFLFTTPLSKANSFCTINNTKINTLLYKNWKMKFLQTISQNYKHAPFFSVVLELLVEVLSKKTHISISDLAIDSVKEISNYMNISTEFIISSEAYQNRFLEKQDRLIDICRKESATNYINASGGTELYKIADFKDQGIKLDFIRSLPIEYKQFTNDFVPWLSIIDVLMFNSSNDLQELLERYEFIN